MGTEVNVDDLVADDVVHSESAYFGSCNLT